MFKSNFSSQVSAKIQDDVFVATSGDKSCLVAAAEKDLDISVGTNLNVDMVKGPSFLIYFLRIQDSLKI